VEHTTTIPRVRRRLRLVRGMAAGVVAVMLSAGCSSGSGSSSTPITTRPPDTLAPLTPVTSVTAATTATPPALATLPPVTPAPTTLPPPTLAPTTLPPTTLPPTLPPAPPAPTTTTALVKAGAVILVANASGVPGAALKLNTELRAAGFTTTGATNASGTETTLDVSKVYVLPGAEAVAQTVAAVMGGLVVAQMPVPAPITNATAALGEATVLVMLGKDFAGKKPPGL
jgi:hypothetical protein